MTSSTKREWLVPTGLIMLSLVPVAAGGARVAEWVLRRRPAKRSRAVAARPDALVGRRADG